MVNLGKSLWLLGDLTGCDTVLSAGLEMRERRYGEVDMDSFKYLHTNSALVGCVLIITGRFFHALGTLRFDQNNRPKSEWYHRRALQQYRSTIGRWHHTTADVLHQIAQHCIRRDMLPEAE